MVNLQLEVRFPLVLGLRVSVPLVFASKQTMVFLAFGMMSSLVIERMQENKTELNTKKVGVLRCCIKSAWTI